MVKLPLGASRLLGCTQADGVITRLLKPMYGQGDAPRRWYLVADERLRKCGFVPHVLDPRLYLSYDDTKPYQPDGMISLHVDDMLGAGDSTGSGERCYAARVKKLRER